MCAADLAAPPVISIAQFDVFLVRPDPTRGTEIKKTRPCVVVSPDEMNRQLRTVIIAPMTTTIRDFPSRVTVNFQDTAGQIALDQLRAVDRTRLTIRLGAITTGEAGEVKTILHEMFG